MRILKSRRAKLIGLVGIFAVALVWHLWNKPTRTDMTTYIPTDSLAFMESDDLPRLTQGIEGTQAWQQLASPLGAPKQLLPNRWLITLAKWTGIGSVDAVLAARSQVALAFSQPEASANEQTLTIKPHAALIIETHTTQRRMRSAMEDHVGAFANRVYGSSTMNRKQLNALDLTEWSSNDGSRRIVLAFVDSTVIVGNDEAIVLHCADVRLGRVPSINSSNQLQQVRALMTSTPSLFAFVPKAGVKPIVQGWVLNRPGVTGDQVMYAQLISKAFSNLIDAFAWTSEFDSAGAHDKCTVLLSSGAGLRLANNAGGQPISAADFSFVPADAASITTYQFRDPSGFWQDLKTVISSHSDAIGAIASHQVLRALLQPYGIGDADAFFAAVGPRLQLIRVEKEGRATMIADALDQGALRKLAEQRLGPNSKTQPVSGIDVTISADGNWSFAIVENKFLIGPPDVVQRCLGSRHNARAIESVESFTRAKQMIDVSAKALSINLTNDRTSAISFIGSFSNEKRSALSSNNAVIDQRAAALPFAVSITTINGDAVQWDSRSAFGMLGSLFTTFGGESH